MRILNTSLALVFPTLLLVSTYARDETVSDAAKPQSRENDATRSLTEHAMEFEAMYLRTYFSMSMTNGKGVSKARDDTKIGSSKAELDKSSKKSKASKSSKVKETKDSKSKTSKKTGGTIAPTVSAMPSTASAPSAVAPSAPVSRVPVPTLPPNTEGKTVSATPYYLFYTIEQTRIPTLDDYSELGLFTSDYLNVYFQVIFGEDPAAGFVSSITEVTGSDFRLGQPTRVDFKTALTFAATSESLPSVADVDTLLRSAFEGENAATYTTALDADLNETNIFSTTSLVTFEYTPTDNTELRVGIVAAVATFAFMLLLGGAVIYRTREEAEEIEAKRLDITGNIEVANATDHDDATLETYEQTQHTEDDDESTVYSSGNLSRTSNETDSVWRDMRQPRQRLNTVPPDFDDDDFSCCDSVTAVSRKSKRKETPTERRMRLENLAT